MSNALDILISTPLVIWPASFGSAIRTLAVARALAGSGHRVTLLSPNAAGPEECLGPNARWRCYPAARRTGYFLSRGLARALEEELAAPKDLLITESPFSALHVVAAARRAAVPLVFASHNVEADRFRSLGRRHVAKVVSLTERHLCRGAAAVLAVSAADRDLFRALYGVEALLLPNGVDPELWRQDAAAPRGDQDDGAPSILYFGSYAYPPNVAALRYLLMEVRPQVIAQVPRARFVVVGDSPPPWAHGLRNTAVTGLVADIGPYLRSASLVAVPLFAGGGTRLKIIETLACGRPVVATELAAQGIAGAPAGLLRLAAPKDFAAAVVATLVARPCPATAEIEQFRLRYQWDRLVRQIPWHAFAAKTPDAARARRSAPPSPLP